MLAVNFYRTVVISSINFFKATPPKKWENHAYPTAATEGFIVLKNNCLYLSDKKNSNKNLRIISWPWNYTLKQTKSGIHIMNGKHQVAAKVGSYAKFGGVGLSIRNKRFKKKNKFQNCISKNVIGSWFASPS